MMECRSGIMRVLKWIVATSDEVGMEEEKEKDEVEENGGRKW